MLLGHELGLGECMDEIWLRCEGLTEMVDRGAEAGGDLAPGLIGVRIGCDGGTIVRQCLNVILG